MNREVHVRFWESPEVKVLRATRQPCALSRFNHKLGKGALAFRMDRFVKFTRASGHRREGLIP